jgi:hypothetical protein
VSALLPGSPRRALGGAVLRVRHQASRAAGRPGGQG